MGRQLTLILQYAAIVLAVWLSFRVILAGPGPVPLDSNGKVASPTDYPWDSFYLR
jgi:hypothetical protein